MKNSSKNVAIATEVSDVNDVVATIEATEVETAIEATEATEAVEEKKVRVSRKTAEDISKEETLEAILRKEKSLYLLKHGKPENAREYFKVSSFSKKTMLRILSLEALVAYNKDLNEKVAAFFE
jgi:hypothetical protein